MSMTIDPSTSKKHSGRSGDPVERLGRALAQSDRQSSRRVASGAGDAPPWQSMGLGRAHIAGIVVAFLVIIIAFWLMSALKS